MNTLENKVFYWIDSFLWFELGVLVGTIIVTLEVMQ